MSGSTDKLYVFVKGHKGVGAFAITGSDFHEIYNNVVEKENETHQHYMDLHAIEEGLDYIVRNRGKNQIPKQPVVCIYTTYENIYDVLSQGHKSTDKDKYKKITDKLEKFKDTINKNRAQKDGVKYFWIPANVEKHLDKIIDGLKQALLDHKNKINNKP